MNFCTYFLCSVSIVLTSQVQAQGAADNFLDVLNLEQSHAFGEGFPSNGDTSGISGNFYPRTYSTSAGSLDPNNGQVSPHYSVRVSVQRRLVKGRVALLANFSGSGLGGRNTGALNGAQFKAVQNGAQYAGIVFNSGQPGGWPALVAFNTTNGQTIPTNGNPAGTSTVILGQSGGGFNPLKEFALYYIGADLTQPQTVLTLPDYPSVTAGFSPSTLTRGQNYSVVSNTSAADSLKMKCTGAAATSEALTVGSQSLQRTATETGQTNCTFTAMGVGGMVKVDASRVVVAPIMPAPTVSASYSPNPVNAGAYYTLTTSTTNASNLTYSCTGGFTGSGPLTAGQNISVTALADAAYVGTTLCNFTANGPGGVADSSATQTILPPVPTVAASYAPNPVKVGATYTITTNTTNAAALTYSCTGAFTGSGSLTTGSNVSATGVANSAYLGTTNCTFTASGAGGTASSTAQQIIVP